MKTATPIYQLPMNATQKSNLLQHVATCCTAEDNLLQHGATCCSKADNMAQYRFTYLDEQQSNKMKTIYNVKINKLNIHLNNNFKY